MRLLTKLLQWRPTIQVIRRLLRRDVSDSEIWKKLVAYEKVLLTEALRGRREEEKVEVVARLAGRWEAIAEFMNRIKHD